MDTLTQGLLGATAAQLVLGPKLGHRAWIAGMAGGLLPDADVFLQPLADPALPWELHRHFTHALVMVPLMGLLAALPLLLFPAMRRHARLVVGAAVVGALTHGPLDWCTSYGTKILWPFSSESLTIDLYPIVDPLFSIALLIGIIAAARRRRRWPAVATWCFIGLYTLVALVQQDHARGLQETLAQRRGHTIERARVMPAPGSLLVWRSLYEERGALHADLVRSVPWGPPSFVFGDSRHRVALEEALAHVDAADRERATDVLQRFTHFADGYVAWTPDDPTVVGDMRITSNPGFDSLWGIRVSAKPDEPPVSWEMRTGDRRGQIGNLVQTIAGTHPDLRPLPASP